MRTKMKKFTSILKAVLLSCSFLFFLNCDTDAVPQESQAHQHEDTNKITFTDFLGKTKIKKFDLNIEPIALQGDLQSRSSRDFDFTGFKVDTLTVKELVKNGETTFTLPVVPNPFPNNPNFYYNIVFYQVGADYQWSILEFEKIQEEVQVTELLNETTNNGLVNVSGRLEAVWSTKILFHCNKQGACSNGPCDSCKECISLGTVVTIVEEKEFFAIVDTPQNLIGQNGGGITNGNAFSPALNSAINNFKSSLSAAQLGLYNANKSEFDNYLKNNSATLVGSLGQQSALIYPSAQQFVYNVFETIQTLEIEDFVEQTEVIAVMLYASQNNYLNKNVDSQFFQGINNYTSLDTMDPIVAMNFTRLYLAHCAIVRSQNPHWPNYKIFAKAYLDTVQLLLDFAGLVPVIGEVADITNGVIYVISGDGINASLSFASAIPVAGWFTAGVKMAKRADGLRFLVVGANNLITFGAANSTKFRAACGIAVGDATKQAHHIIPRGSQIIEHSAVQKAAQANISQGFHIDSALNGIAVATWRNQPNHNQYNSLIKSKLDAIPSNLTPNQTYAAVLNIMNQAKQAIINNPNTHLNNLIF